MVPAEEPTMWTATQGRRPGIHVPRHRQPPIHSALTTVVRAEALHPLLARHQPPNPGQRLHRRKRPCPRPQPVPVDWGGLNPVTADGRRQTRPSHSPLALAQASSHDGRRQI